MIVTLIKILIEIPDIASIKEKRQIVKSLKDKIQRKFKISIAEVDLQDSLGFSQIGGAIVSNSVTFGEKVMNKVLRFVEDEVPGRIQDVGITSEQF